MSNFKFSRRSKNELVGVHPRLIAVVEMALELSRVDFAVIDGLRTEEEQRDLLQRGVSQTIHSKHLTQKSGYGEAVDLVGYLHGKARWEWPVVLAVAEAMQMAAEASNTFIKWGGAWSVLNDKESPLFLMDAYKERREKEGKTPFIDGPHFELAIPYEI